MLYSGLSSSLASSLLGSQGAGIAADQIQRGFSLTQGALGALANLSALPSAPARVLDMDFSSYISECKKELEDDFLELSVNGSDGA